MGFSLGKEPYVGQNVEDMIMKLKDGYSLPCPEEAHQLQNWSPIEIYNKLATYCFVTEPLKRGCFSHLVQVIEGVLNDDEKLAYKELTEQYESMRELLLDKTTRFKRSISQYKKDDADVNYSKLTDTTNISSPDDSSPLISNNIK